MKNINIDEIIRDLTDSELLELYKKVDEHLNFLNNSIIDLESEGNKDE